MRLGSTDRWSAWHRILTILQVSSSIIIPITGIALKCEAPAGATSFKWMTVILIQDNAFVIFIVATGFLWLAQAVKSYFGNPWIWESVKLLLEEMRSDVFANHPDALAHTDRVTLFKKRPIRMRYLFVPTPDWVCAVERSGHMTRRDRVWFRAHDDGLQLEGFAGTTFGYGVTMLKDSLPQITEASSRKEIALYAKETFVTEEYVRKQIQKRAPLPRALCGIVVEVNSKPWGVIVIDSVCAQLAPKETIETFFRKHAKILGKILSKL